MLWLEFNVFKAAFATIFALWGSLTNDPQTKHNAHTRTDRGKVGGWWGWDRQRIIHRKERVGEREIKRRRLRLIVSEIYDKGVENFGEEQVPDMRQDESAEEHDEEDNEELARFEDDTDSFMLRKRELLFAGLPPGDIRGREVHIYISLYGDNNVCRRKTRAAVVSIHPPVARNYDTPKNVRREGILRAAVTSIARVSGIHPPIHDVLQSCKAKDGRYVFRLGIPCNTIRVAALIACNHVKYYLVVR